MIIYYHIQCFIFCLVRHSSAQILCFSSTGTDTNLFTRHITIVAPIHIRENPPQFKNRIMAWVYVRSNIRSTMYQRAPFPKSLISGINAVYVFFQYLLKKHTHKLHVSRLFCCNHTCYCVNIVSVASTLRYH